MRTVVFLVMMAVAGQGWAVNAFYTGNELLQECESQQAARVNMCRAYLAAVADGIDYNRTLKSESNDPQHDTHVAACPPTGIKLLQVQKVWGLWANQHPQHLHQGAYNLVMNAFADAWPCLKVQD